MINLGSWNELTILRYTSVGLYLGEAGTGTGTGTGTGEGTGAGEGTGVGTGVGEGLVRRSATKAGEGATGEAMVDEDKTAFTEAGGDVTESAFAKASADKEEVLLPKKYCPDPFNIGDTINVFVYRDSEDRKIATTLKPYVTLGEFAFLKVKSVNEVGAFMDWGLEKDLMVPFREQKRKMEEGRWYVIYLTIDQQTDRLVGSNKPDKFLQNEQLFVKEGEQVDLIVLKKHEMGYDVAVNHLHKGMLYHNEVFSDIKIGDSLSGFIHHIRPDNKLDIRLQEHGYEQSIEGHTGVLLNELKEQGGFLPLTDKSAPEAIYEMLGISKKAFKKALGALYKEKKVHISEKGIKLL